LKYKYIVYWELSDEGRALGSDGWTKYFKNQDEITKKHGFKLLARGSPFGVIESVVEIYESENYIDKLSEAYTEAGRSKYVSAARTVTVVPLAFER